MPSIAKLLMQFARVVGDGYSYCPHGRGDVGKQQTVGTKPLNFQLALCLPQLMSKWKLHLSFETNE